MDICWDQAAGEDGARYDCVNRAYSWFNIIRYLERLGALQFTSEGLLWREGNRVWKLYDQLFKDFKAFAERFLVDLRSFMMSFSPKPFPNYVGWSSIVTGCS